MLADKYLRTPQNVVSADFPQNVGVISDLKSKAVGNGDPTLPDIPWISHFLYVQGRMLWIR